MAKKTFGRGSIHDLVLASEEEQQKEKDLALTTAAASSQIAEKAAPAQANTNGLKEAEGHEAPTPAISATQEVNSGGEQSLKATSIGLSAGDILSSANSYHNSKRQVNIAESYYTFLRAISNLCGVNISQIVNNMLQPYFEDKALIKEIKSLAGKKYKENMNVVDKHM